MLTKEEIIKNVAKVKATMEIEGLYLNKNDIKTITKIAEGKLKSDDLIKKYIRRVKRITEKTE